MNLGKRIELRLAELEWDRSELFDRVPALTPSALSALIKRDSKRCELDGPIAKALGVHLEWLNNNELPKLLTDTAGTKPHGVVRLQNPLIAELMSHVERMSEDGLKRLIGRAEGFAEQYPRTVKEKSEMF